jgi:phenylalanine-4-hydroxylase
MLRESQTRPEDNRELSESRDLVILDPDHPGFRDPFYRGRRNAIAKLALEHVAGAPIPGVDYTNDEHGVWKSVLAHLTPLHSARASAAWCRSSKILRLSKTRIPQLSEIDSRLEATGIRMLPVAGLIAARGFLSALSDGVFLSTQYIRHPSRPLYTPEPDIIHEVVGHAASFFDPYIAEMTVAFGQAARRADDETVLRLERLYWYTLEFGLVREPSGIKALGAGLISSFGELEEFERSAEIRSLDLAEIAETPYDPTSYQKVLFVAESVESLARQLLKHLRSL